MEYVPVTLDVDGCPPSGLLSTVPLVMVPLPSEIKLPAKVNCPER